ncbi:MAG: hypothetical protein ABIR14_02370 [Candidatus Paceibacterota bacterium]
MRNIIKVVLVGVVLLIMVWLGFRTSSVVIVGKDSNCITDMQKAIPDPNDTEQRSAFLKNCEQ